MDKILVTYRGGYGDIYSILSYFNEIKGSKITFLVEQEHTFLSKLFKNVNFIINPIYKIIGGAVQGFSDSILEHIRIKEDTKNFSQDRYDDSVVEVAFYIPSLYKPYYNFYKKLVDEHDLIISNYLDLTATNACLNSNKEWWQIRSWYKWREDLPHVNLLNLSSPYKNIYYYEKDWIKGYEADPNGDYIYRDTDFFYNVSFKDDARKINIIVEPFDIETKLKKHNKVFFATLGSMSKHNLRIGSGMKYVFIDKIKELFNDGWVGITTKNEYNAFLKNIINEKFVHVVDEWYPHSVIFKNIDLFLTHGGAGSFSRVIKENKKAWVFPFQLDQFYFGDILQKNYGAQMFEHIHTNGLL
jgi:hypothetical protein